MAATTYLVQGLADYVADLRYEDLSPAAVKVAKQCVLDCYGNMLYGRYCETGHGIMEYFAAADALPKAEDSVSLIGGDGRTSCKEAVIFAHTAMARCADLDDGYRHAMGHPGASLVPLALSLAQLHKLGGKDVITALAAGYDIYARLGEAVNPNMYRERGFESTGICGAVAAAAMAAKMAGGTAKVIKDAMGLASLFTGGLIEYQNDGSSGKIFCGGWGALTGMRAAALAAKGFTGPDAALEGKKGFFQAFKGTSGHLVLDHVLEGLGTDFKITRIYFKRHSCMRGLHATIDAMLALREEFGLTPATIRSVAVNTSTFVLRLSNPAPKTAVGAQASTEFCSAVALKHGRIDSEELVLESFHDAEVLDLARRIAVVKDDAVQRYLEENPTHFGAVRVVVETVDGARREKWLPTPLGDEETPFDWDMLEAKFASLIEKTPYASKGSALCRLIVSLENAETMDALLRS